MKECKKQKGHHSYKIGTWNVWTLKQRGKLVNLKMEMQKKSCVLGVSQVRWTGQDENILNCIGHILRRNWLQKQVMEGKIKGQIEVKRRQLIRCKKLLDDHKDRRGYCELKEEALDDTMWRNRSAKGFEPVV